MGKPTREASLRGAATIWARADAFARSMAGTIAALEREGITSSYGMAKALNERAVATALLQALGRQDSAASPEAAWALATATTASPAVAW